MTSAEEKMMLEELAEIAALFEAKCDQARRSDSSQAEEQLRQIERDFKSEVIELATRYHRDDQRQDAIDALLTSFQKVKAVDEKLLRSKREQSN